MQWEFGSTIMFHLKAMESQVFHTVWCNITGEAAGEIWTWSLLRVKGLKVILFLIYANFAGACRSATPPRPQWRGRLGPDSVHIRIKGIKCGRGLRLSLFVVYLSFYGPERHHGNTPFHRAISLWILSEMTNSACGHVRLTSRLSLNT